MQALRSVFEAHIERVYSQPLAENRGNLRSDVGNEHTQGGTGKRLKIFIDWGALDIDRDPEVFSGTRASEAVARFFSQLIRTFGESMKDQLQELPVIRFPLSEDANSFVNPSTGDPYGSVPVGETGLYLCHHSSTEEKQRRLNEVIGRLTLPDGSNFPEGCIEFSIEGGE